KYFRKGFRNGDVIGVHFLGRFLTGYGGKVAPPFQRFYMGGENDIRGFDIWTISPIAFIPTEGAATLYDNSGNPIQQKIFNADGSYSFVNQTRRLPVYQFVEPGGDTNLIVNFEYRIPIFGPVHLAPFFDA